MIDRKSGYDPVTGICWNFQNKGDYHHWKCKCPAHSKKYGERTSASFGRCRSGSRWFWVAGVYFEGNKAFGWADTEELAMAAATAAVRDFRNGLPMLATLMHGCASLKLKELNEAKRRARPTPDTSDAHVTEYLYGHTIGGEVDGSPVRFQITKKTAKRIYYMRWDEYLDEQGEPRQDIRRHDEGTGYVNRQKLEAEGQVRNRGVHWSASDHHLYASLEGVLRDRRRHDEEEQPDLRQLKAEMAAAHPDKGGNSTAFIAARERYIRARREARS
jgi:hypothetical protein